MKKMKKKLVLKSISIGILATIALFSLYITILSWANSFDHAIGQFLIYKYWISALVIGFGIQIGMFMYLKQIIKLRKMKGIKTEIAATGSISTASMVACCLHHISDVVPLLGISAAAIFFNKYQTWFMAIGIISNLFGIFIMLRVMKKHNIYTDKCSMTHKHASR